MGRKKALHPSHIKRFLELQQSGDLKSALAYAEQLSSQFPESPQAWELYANGLAVLGRLREAAAAMERVVETSPVANPPQWLKLAQYLILGGEAKKAIASLERVVSHQPENVEALAWLSRAYYEMDDTSSGISVSDRALAIDPLHEETLVWRARIQDRLKQHEPALETLGRLLDVAPKRVGVNNHIASLYVKEGDYSNAEKYFNNELELSPDNGRLLCNRFIANHYNPGYSLEDLFYQAVEWDKKFSSTSVVKRASTLLDPEKQLRIGLLSGGFRTHPVGQMILPALNNLKSEECFLVAYSTNQKGDALTGEIKDAVDEWKVVEGLSDEQLDKLIRDDSIDVLIDMNGAGEGSRYGTLVKEPAPLLVKWVGTLINTTGLACMDYLISDHVETPEGVDQFYTEKLIRLPDDYICYRAPDYIPDCGELPVLKNGYITFGCLNNPAKLSPPMLAEWAKLLEEVPNSKLLLRGIQFESQRFCDKLREAFAKHGIGSDRLLLEGGAKHRQFMATYQRIDIALDTWPYSGGLTTCEALVMGVPVVTRVGPTFAGRHSATHLSAVGLDELVAESWDDFIHQAVGLATDLDALSRLRCSLRSRVMASPLCDGPRFASHFYNALRAIWQRHCQGRAPERLNFDKSGNAWFGEQKDNPVEVVKAAADVVNTQVESGDDSQDERFDWELTEPVTVIDNTARLAYHPECSRAVAEKKLAVICFDPANQLEKRANALAFQGDFHHFPYAVLGDGSPRVVYDHGDGSLSTLSRRSILDENKSHIILDGSEEETRINTVALDHIEGIPNLDVLILDELHDTLSILDNGVKAVKNTLAIEVAVVFSTQNHGKLEIGKAIQWMEKHGFRFHSLTKMDYRCHFPEHLEQVEGFASELEWGNALFIPSSDRLDQLSEMENKKLAYVLDVFFGIKDLSFRLLEKMGGQTARKYGIHIGALSPTDSPAFPVKDGHGASFVSCVDDLKCKKVGKKLCVGVPVYNEEKYIRRTIRSLKEQDFEDVSFLISDNCSTDRSLSIVLEEVCGDERFEVFKHEKNIGGYANFEFLFRSTNSEYFMWLGGHDYLSKGYLTRVVSEIEADNSLSMVCGYPFGVVDDGRIETPVEKAVYNFNNDALPEVRYLESVAKISNCTVFHSVFRRRLLRGFEFRKTISADHVLLSHLLWFGGIKQISDVKYIRRYFSSRDQSQSQRISGENKVLERDDFFKYYEDGLRLLYKINESSVKVPFSIMLKNVSEVLDIRFSKKTVSQ
ncbi:hypothetical protein HPA02_24550 [Bisbaumannia pacifica]|nr:hypothetical protein HPA02_24550 [Halomonas pacifica]